MAPTLWLHFCRKPQFKNVSFAHFWSYHPHLLPSDSVDAKPINLMTIHYMTAAVSESNRSHLWEKCFGYVHRGLSSMWRGYGFQVHTAASHQGMLKFLSYSQCAEGGMGNRHKMQQISPERRKLKVWEKERRQRKKRQSKKCRQMSKNVSRVFGDLTANKTNIQAAAVKHPEPVFTVWEGKMHTFIRAHAQNICKTGKDTQYLQVSVISVSCRLLRLFGRLWNVSALQRAMFHPERLSATTPAEHKHSHLHCLNRGGVTAAWTAEQLQYCTTFELLKRSCFFWSCLSLSDYLLWWRYFVFPEVLLNEQTRLFVHSIHLSD